MRFLNQREEIYDIQLTQHGKRLLAQGLLEPVYYAFFDNEIIYEDRYMGVSSSQSGSIDRLQCASYLGSSYIKKGVETTFKKWKKAQNQMFIEPEIFSLSIGSSEIGNHYRSAFSVKFLQNELTGSVEFLSSSFENNQMIPQISSSVLCDIYIRTTEPVTSGGPLTHQDVEQKVYEDGSYLFLDKTPIFLEMVEKNCLNGKSNFEIEVFEVKNNINGEEELVSLKFEGDKTSLTDLSTDYVQYFFDIDVDDEVSNADYCKYVPKTKGESVFVKDERSCVVEDKSGFSYKKNPIGPEGDCE